MSSVSNICKQGGTGGWILPISKSEQDLSNILRACIYGSVMTYCFLGVSIIADNFMNAIEAISGRRKQVRRSDGRYKTVKVWNKTIATLSLMALGSSAPEIFLSVMDTLKKKFHFGALGPATIVGSAAFNLLIIVGFCILVIPSTEIRKISDIETFYVTAVFSVIAYLWLALITAYMSYDIIEVWEAVVTLLFFFALLIVSYGFDKGFVQDGLRKLQLISYSNEKSDTKEDCICMPVLSFSAETQDVEGSPHDRNLEVHVKLSEDAIDCHVSCTYRTEGLNAVPGYDYVQQDGRLEFPKGVTEQKIEITALPKSKVRKECSFLVLLEDAEGASFDPDTDGGDECAIQTIKIIARNCRSPSKMVEHALSANHMHYAIGSWRQKLWESVYCNGSPEEQAEASKRDWAFHILCLPWKLIFMSVPPAAYASGWICFWISLLWIAIMSALLSDLAEMFGCVLQVPEIITAITFVATGTSMPDLFASLVAAKEDDDADASIVNVTGSNSVNVFLGLGVPWTIGALYWQVVGRTQDWEDRYGRVASRVDGAAFIVDSRNLGFSVICFLCACIAAIVLLSIRRKCIGGELGGSFVPKVATFVAFICYWTGFIFATCWRALRYGKIGTAEYVIVLSSILCVEVIVSLVVIFILCLHYRRRGEHQNSESGQTDNGHDDVEKNQDNGETKVPLESLISEAAATEQNDPGLLPPAAPVDPAIHDSPETFGRGMTSMSWTVEDESPIVIKSHASSLAAGAFGNSSAAKKNIHTLASDDMQTIASDEKGN